MASRRSSVRARPAPLEAPHRGPKHTRPGRSVGAVSLQLQSPKVTTVDLVEFPPDPHPHRMVDSQMPKDLPFERAAETVSIESKPKAAKPIDRGQTATLDPSDRLGRGGARLVSELSHGVEALAVDDLRSSRAHLPAPLLGQGGIERLIRRGAMELEHRRIEPLAEQLAAPIQHRFRLSEQVFIANLDVVLRLERSSQLQPASHRFAPVPRPTRRLSNPTHPDA